MSKNRAGNTCAPLLQSSGNDRRQRAFDTLVCYLLVRVMHDTTYDALREVSPLLDSRSGPSNAEDTMANIAAKLAEAVTL